MGEEPGYPRLPVRLRNEPVLALEFRVSPKRLLFDVWVAADFTSPARKRACLFEKVEEALGLIRRWAPIRFADLRRDLVAVLVTTTAVSSQIWARYIPGLRLAILNLNWLLSEDTSPIDVASALVHEAQHARLFRLGFGYAVGKRWQIERLCLRAEKNFGKRSPDGERVVRRAALGLKHGREGDYDSRTLIQTEIDELRSMGTSGWIIRALSKLADRKLGPLPNDGTPAHTGARHTKLGAEQQE